MIAALSLSAWRAGARRRLCAVLAMLAVAIHALAMAAHHPPAADLAFLDDPHALCLSGEGGAIPASDSGTPLHPHAPPCPICQSLQAAVPPPQAPCIVATPWVVARTIVPQPAAPPPPRLVLTDLNPRGPPVLG
jgi:hypothetical protein